MTIDESPDGHLDHLMQGLGAIDPKLPPSTHAAILARVIDESAAEAEPFASAVIEVAPSRGARRAPLALGLGLAAAAAIGLMWWVRPVTEPTPAMTVVDAGVPVAVRVVPPRELEPDRIAGERSILPDAATRARMVKDGTSRVIGSFKLCVNRQGKVGEVTLLKSTGYPDYDRELVAGVRVWSYRPRSDEVCTEVTFIFGIDQ